MAPLAAWTLDGGGDAGELSAVLGADAAAPATGTLVEQHGPTATQGEAAVVDSRGGQGESARTSLRGADRGGAGTGAGRRVGRTAALSGGIGGAEALEPLVRAVLDALAEGAERRGGPIPAGTPEEIAALVAREFAEGGRLTAAAQPDGAADRPLATPDGEAEGTLSAADGNPVGLVSMPDGDALRSASAPGGGPVPSVSVPDGDPLRSVSAPDGDAGLRRLSALLAHGSADPADPSCAAHLHCPPLAVAVAADLAVSALNPSQDSWDQAPAATALETLLLQEMAQLVGYDPAAATGVLTSGGTESNLMGLMLARDRDLARVTGRQVELSGVPGGGTGPRPRIFASAAAHFSVQRAAALLGLGEDSVVPVPVDHELRMDPQALAEALRECTGRGELPVAVVATAGTTDTGAVDPLGACAALAAEHGAWLHVDAAYGGGALLSDRLAPLVDGIAP
ncbi:pyridoxal phosphate-dependent decarboxylase family protein [Streptomyces sp. 7N604]|uniref:pyridoxal phosphate-dependent decarboxylase family protein n=1 Tax=Streptomyces sp. 7N604 TaxID=3457415 RepID=UPI003FD41E16